MRKLARVAALFLLASPAFAAPAFVSIASGSTGSTVTSLATGSFNAVAGNTLEVFCRTGIATQAYVQDTAGNSFQVAGPTTNSVTFNGNLSGGIQVFVATNITANSSDVVTCYFPNYQNVGAPYNDVMALQYSGVSYSDVLASGLAVSATSVSTSAFTTREANEVLVACGTVSGGGSTFTAGSGYTLRGTDPQGDMACEDEIVSSTQSGVTASMSANSTSPWIIVVGTLSSAAPPPPSSPSPVAVGSSFFGGSLGELMLGNGSPEPWSANSHGGQTIGTIRTWDTNGVEGWFEIEHTNNTFLWTYLDELVSEAEANNADVLYTFGRTPQWAIGSAPCINSDAGFTGSPNPGCANAPVGLSNPITSTSNYWATFVTALVQRYAGKIKYYELWNEPNTLLNGAPPSPGMFWNGPTCTTSSCPSIAAQEDLADLVTMAQQAQQIISANDPTATLVLGSPTTAQCSTGQYVTPDCWFNDFFNAGGGSYGGAIGYHGYLAPTLLGQQPEQEGVMANKLQAVLSSFSITGKPIFDTEAGWCYSSNYPDWTARFELMHASLVPRHYWYQWDNVNCGQLWSTSSGLNAAGIAYTTMYQWLAGSSLTPCSTVYGTTWSCPVTEASGNSALAVWNIVGSASYSFSSGTYADFRDVCGNTTTVGTGSSSCNGVTTTLTSTSVSLNTQPILLEGIGSAPTPAPGPPAPPTALTSTVHP